MPFYKKKHLFIAVLLTGLYPLSVFSSEYPQNTDSLKTSKTTSSWFQDSYAIVQSGYYWSWQGEKQHINIKDLVGDEFTVTNHSGGNGFVGLGFFFNGLKRKQIEVAFGINAFYLPKTTVKGTVIQENLFANLSYKYHVTHCPIYAAFNAKVKTPLPNCSVDIDFGIGPNILHVSGFKETPLNSTTLPDHIFSSHTNVPLSLTAGIGIEFYRVYNLLSLELGYRFFYLGEGTFNTLSSQVIDRLSTGNCYANALVFSIKI